MKKRSRTVNIIVNRTGTKGKPILDLDKNKILCHPEDVLRVWNQWSFYERPKPLKRSPKEMIEAMDRDRDYSDCDVQAVREVYGIMKQEEPEDALLTQM